MDVGVGRGGAEGAVPHWIFIHGTDKIEKVLMVLFFGLAFSLAPTQEIFLPTLLIIDGVILPLPPLGRSKLRKKMRNFNF